MTEEQNKLAGGETPLCQELHASLDSNDIRAWRSLAYRLERGLTLLGEREPATEAVLSVNDPNVPTTTGIQIIEALSRDEILEEAAMICHARSDHPYDLADSLACAIRALKGKGASRGADFVRVPREPTPAMLDALEQGPALLRDSESWQDYQRRQWAMVLVAASPDEQKG